MPTTPDAPMPATLSRTGVFENVATLRVIPDMVAYDVNLPFWSDGASKKRWIGLPAGQSIRFSPDGDWEFPAGTVFLKHFESPGTHQRIETRVLVTDGHGGAYGGSYKWRKDGSDADLVVEPTTAPIAVSDASGSHKQSWYFPGVADCRTCHTRVAGGVLGVKTRQINHLIEGTSENQLSAWTHMGFFDAMTLPRNPHELPRLSRLDDTSVSLENRARSFLDVNCAYCHRPGGVAGNFDARFETPLQRQNLIGGPVLINLGIDRARVVTPHDVWRSLALVRVETRDQTRMPPLGHEKTDRQGALVLRSWIESLPGLSVIPPPAAFPHGGEFHMTVRVVLSDPEPGAQIRYTLDGSAPGNTSPIYEKPIEIAQPATLRARAFKAGMTRSIVVQETYIVND